MGFTRGSNYAGKRFKLTNGAFVDESGGTTQAHVLPGTIMQAVGFLTKNPDMLIWHVEHWEHHPHSHPLQDLTSLNLRLAVSFYSVAYPGFDLFVCTAYESMRLEELGPEIAHLKKIIPDFPHKCPKCGKAAYVGFTEIRCSKDDCNPGQR